MSVAGVSRGAEVPDLQAEAFSISPRLIWEGWTENNVERAQYVPALNNWFVACGWIFSETSFIGAKVQISLENTKEFRKYFG